MDNFVLFIFCFFLVLVPVAAGDFSFSMENHTGIITGLTQEYVYEGKKQISRLEWEEKAVPYIHATLDFSWKYFFITGSAKTAIPLESGFMRNYDYLLPGSNALTNFSEHDVFLDRHNTYDIGIGYNFILKKWHIYPVFGFQYSNRKWTAKDGYLQYAVSGKPLQGNEPINYITGSVISYEQKISFFYGFLAIGYKFFNRLLLDINFGFYPYVWAESMDNHIMRSIEFYDEMPGGVGGNLGLQIYYKPAFIKNIEFLLGFDYENFFKIMGKTSKRSSGVNTPATFSIIKNNNSAYDSKLWNIFIGVKFTMEF